MLGVACGLAAGAWLGAAEAPTKLVTVGFSPFLISLGMVAGVFVARWTVPMVLKGTDYVWADLREKPHLMVWALLAGMLWAVANTLTVFAIRNVGSPSPFRSGTPTASSDCSGAGCCSTNCAAPASRHWLKVLGGAAAIVVGACMLAYATTSVRGRRRTAARRSASLAALGAGLLWGTMYIPYRKAYISGMNPLSFVTVFTFGELGTVFAAGGRVRRRHRHVGRTAKARSPRLFWLFLGGFCWVIGDLFQQYAAKYIGIGRGIPLSNTNQLWGLAWGALVFGEFAGLGATAQVLVVPGSLVMIAGAVASALPKRRNRNRTRGARRCSASATATIWIAPPSPPSSVATTRSRTTRRAVPGGSGWSPPEPSASSSGSPQARSVRPWPSMLPGCSSSPPRPWCS